MALKNYLFGGLLLALIGFAFIPRVDGEPGTFQLEADVISAIQNALYEEGCERPCWLGLIPGQSDFDDVQTVAFDQLGQDITGTGVTLLPSRVNYRLGFRLTPISIENRIASLLNDFYFDENDLLTEITLNFMQPFAERPLWDNYLPHHILALYGQPSTVQVGGGQFAYRMWFVYEELDITIFFDGDIKNADIANSIADFCFNAEEVGEIYMTFHAPTAIPLSDLTPAAGGIATNTLETFGLEKDHFTALLQGNPEACFRGRIAIPGAGIPPLATATLAPYPALTSTPQPLATPTLIPENVPIEDLSQVMKPTQDCELPWWWGLHPGITRLEEVMPILETRFEYLEVRRVGTAPDAHFLDITVKGMDTNQQSHSAIILGINATDGIINRLLIWSPPIDRFGTIAAPAWSYFSIQNIANNLGMPDVIEAVAYQSEELGLVAPLLTLYWTSLDIIVSYPRLSPASPAYSLGLGTGCFRYENLEALGIDLRAPNAPFSLRDMAGDLSIRATDISTLTDFTNAEFMDILMENEGCLPADLPVYDEPIPISPTLSLTPTSTATP